MMTITLVDRPSEPCQGATNAISGVGTASATAINGLLASIAIETAPPPIGGRLDADRLAVWLNHNLADPPHHTSTGRRSSRRTMKLSNLAKVVTHIVAHSLGYQDAEEAETIARVLLYAQVRGNSQGVIKVLTKGVPPSAGARNPIVTEHETKLSARLNGRGASGMLLMERATRVAIAKAQEHGMAIVAAHGSGSGTGAIGYFGRRIAESGLVGIVLSQSPELMAPYGSYEPIFGTNPFAVGIPTQVQAQGWLAVIRPTWTNDYPKHNPTGTHFN